ncbi:MAG TPA: FtsX-like permease family protein [Aestuariivirgaceae bacterium]|jgi:cell division transport system permease protein
MTPAPIIPVDAQPMRTLTLSMAVMCYLATLALGALMLVEAAVSQWTSGIASEITVQVRPLSTRDTDHEVNEALRILSTTKGVSSVRKLDSTAAGELLKPWLGEIRMFDELPLPVLIAAAVDQHEPPDLAALQKRLAEKVEGASLDTHLRWQSQLVRTAATLHRLSIAILALIALSATGLVVFATRSVLDANRHVIEVLHLVGAKDSFIARAVKGRFLKSAFFAGLVGTVGGILTFALMGAFGAPVGDARLAEASTNLLIAPPTVALATYLVFFLVPVCATFLSLVTAHLAIMRQLRGT